MGKNFKEFQMIVKFKTQYAYSIDKVNVISSNAGDVADLDCDLAKNLINKGVCELNTYTPVEETKVIIPETKQKTKRRSKKKAE